MSYGIHFQMASSVYFNSKAILEKIGEKFIKSIIFELKFLLRFWEYFVEKKQKFNYKRKAKSLRLR